MYITSAIANNRILFSRKLPNNLLYDKTTNVIEISFQGIIFSINCFLYIFFNAKSLSQKILNIKLINSNMAINFMTVQHARTTNEIRILKATQIWLGFYAIGWPNQYVTLFNLGIILLICYRLLTCWMYVTQCSHTS